MAKTYEYKRTTMSKLKAVGMINVDNMTINIDGEDKSIKKLLEDFDNIDVTLTVSVKIDEDLDRDGE